MDLLHAQLLGHVLAHAGGVAGQHDGVHALHDQVDDGLLGGGLDLVGDDQKAAEFSVHRDVDHCAELAVALAVLVHVDVFSVHQLFVAGQHPVAVDLGLDALARDLFRFGHAAGVQVGAGPLDAFGDGMVGDALGQGGVLHHLQVVGLAVDGDDLGDLENALGQGAGLIKHSYAGFGQGLEVVAALDQDAALRRAADAAEEGEGDGDDQRAGAADDQEGQGAHDPVQPVAQEQRRHKGQHQRADADGRGVVTGKLGDEVLDGSLLQAGIFHQIEDLCHGGVVVEGGGLDAEDAFLIDAAADDVVAGAHGAGAALAGQGGGVQRGFAGDDLAVQGDLLAGFDHDDGADLHIVRVDHADVALGVLQVGALGADVHQGGDAAAALAHGVGLEQLADLVEQHNGHALAVLAAGDRADRGDGHEEVFVEDFAVFDAHEGFAQDIMADDEVGHQPQDELDEPRQGNKVEEQRQGHREDGSNDDALQRLFLLFVHGVGPPFGV